MKRVDLIGEVFELEELFLCLESKLLDLGEVCAVFAFEGVDGANALFEIEEAVVIFFESFRVGLELVEGFCGGDRCFV